MEKSKIMLNSIIFKSLLSGIVLLILTIVSCSSDDSGMNPDEGVFPDSNLSYALHIQPIFFEDCATVPGCHQSSSRAGGLDLESSNPTFIGDDGLMIQAFNAQQSYLFQSLFDDVSGITPRMPPNAPRISDAKIKAIETWINEGALTAN